MQGGGLCAQSNLYRSTDGAQSTYIHPLRMILKKGKETLKNPKKSRDTIPSWKENPKNAPSTVKMHRHPWSENSYSSVPF